MNNYQLACKAVSKVLNVNVEIKDGCSFLDDKAVIFNGNKHAYINWRSYEGVGAKQAYYGIHSLCRELIKFYG